MALAPRTKVSVSVSVLSPPKVKVDRSVRTAVVLVVPASFWP